MINFNADFSTDTFSIWNADDSNEEHIIQIQSVAFAVLGIVIIFGVIPKMIELPYIRQGCNRLYSQTKDFAYSCLQSLFFYYLATLVDNSLPVWETMIVEYKKNIESDKTVPSTIKKSARASREIRKKLTVFEPLSRKTVENVFKKHIQPGRILELGADVAKDGMSFLGRMASPEYRNRMIYTDLTPTRKNVNELNVTKMESQLKKGSHTNIVSQCVLDTISREHLPSIVNGLSHALKPKGRVIIISDLFFDQSPLIRKHASESNFMYVDVVNGNLGIKLIRRSDLLERAAKIGERFVSFLHSIMELPIKEQFNLMQLMYVANSYLYYVLNNLCEKDKYEFIDHKLSFTGDLSRAFEQHEGFKIIENGYHTEEAFGSSRQYTNSLSLDVRASTYTESKHDRSLPFGTAKISATCYLFVAEKK